MALIFFTEAILLVFHVTGLLFAIRSLFQTRTPQGTVAWSIALITFPYLAVPLYIMFGRSRFEGYAKKLRKVEVISEKRRSEIAQALKAYFGPLPPSSRSAERVFENLAEFDFSNSNSVDLYSEGAQFFEELFAAISQAKSYILIEFYILRDDTLGRTFRDLLIKKRKEGVRVYLLFDGLGSYFLPEKYISSLRDAGVDIHSFYKKKGLQNIFQVNFRNHRKIVVIDGTSAFLGGHNIGDEYLGKSKKFGEWRDTSVRVQGPSVVNLQQIFHTDWIWSTERPIEELEWSLRAAPGGAITALAVGTGPVEGPEGGSLLFLQLIGMASKRLWIANPYFVPDESIIKALQLAAARGVEVKILIPHKSDNILVWLAAFSYFEECIESGISLYRYRPGFLHQKVMLVDDEWASVGTANLDNRSLRLNFEVSVITFGAPFAEKVRCMLDNDFKCSSPITIEDYSKRSLPFRVAVRFSRLLSPIL